MSFIALSRHNLRFDQLWIIAHLSRGKFKILFGKPSQFYLNRQGTMAWHILRILSYLCFIFKIVNSCMDSVSNKLSLNRQMYFLNSTAICILCCSTLSSKDKSVDISKGSSFEGLALQYNFVYFEFEFKFNN